MKYLGKSEQGVHPSRVHALIFLFMLLSGEDGHEDEHMNEAEEGEKEKDERKMRIDWYGAPEFQWRSKKTKQVCLQDDQKGSRGAPIGEKEKKVQILRLLFQMVRGRVRFMVKIALELGII